MEKVRLYAQKAQYLRGIDHFLGLSSPTSSEQCWAGICYLHENRFIEAEVQLRQAHKAGERAAVIHLACLQFTQGQVQEALSTLQQVSPSDLNDEDAACWYRERVRYGWLLGEPKARLLDWAKQAWNLAIHTPTELQVAVAVTVGDVHNHFGEPAAGLAYLDFALEQANPRRREYTQICRASALTALSRFEEAHQALDQIESAAVLLQRDLRRMKLWWAQGKWNELTSQLPLLLKRCQGRPAQEVWVRTALLAMAQTGDAAAKHHYYRAQELAQSPFAKATLDHRAGHWLIRRGDASGMLRLQAAQAFFLNAGHLFEAALVNLTLAEVTPVQRGRYLHEAAALIARMSVPPPFGVEWRFHPECYQYLQQLPEGAFERLLLTGTTSPLRVELHTLGQVALLMNGAVVNLRLKRSEELLCYLLRQGAVTLAQVQRDLFLDVPKIKAKNYFHQMRVELAARVPGLKVDYDEPRKIYRLTGGVNIHWDVHALEDSLRQGGWPEWYRSGVEFLPEHESDWAEQERKHLSRWLTTVGLETMQTWYDQGEYQKCISLAERLLPIDPVDEELHAFLLNATFQVKGRLAAVRLYHESATTFLKEVGEIPLGLQQLHHQWTALH